MSSKAKAPVVPALYDSLNDSSLNITGSQPAPFLSPKPERFSSSSSRGNASQMNMSMSLSASIACPSFRLLRQGLMVSPVSNKKKKKGVRLNEGANQFFEISSRSIRVERGDLNNFYPADYVPEPAIECCMCKYEAESDDEAGTFRIFNLPDGSWRLVCPKCNPPDPSWQFDRTVAVSDDLLPPELLQHVFTFLSANDRQIAAHVCKSWDDFAWATFTLHDDAEFRDKVSHPKFRNVCILRVYLSDEFSANSFIGLLCEHLGEIFFLRELQVTGVMGDAGIVALAESLAIHRFMQILDLGACEFHQDGLRAVLAALETNVAEKVELFLPLCCMDSPAHKYSGLQQAYAAPARLIGGTKIKAVLV